MNNILCRKCSGSGVFLQQKGMQVGMYCDSCGAWLKWVSKKEQQTYKMRGMKIYPQNFEVELKGTTLGVEIIKTNNEPITNLGVQEDVPFESDNSTSFGTNPKDLDIEAEIERRVAEKLKDIKVSYKTEDSKEELGIYCPICDGTPLTPEDGSKVEVSIFSGVMTVTDINGIEILGLYRLKRCPCCGKIF